MPDKNSFSCFGCNRFGDIFTMVQEMENITFVEAMHFLAEKFNIPLEKSRFQAVKKDDYLLINELACAFFKENLFGGGEGKKALAYLNKRGLQKETLEPFSMGYAPNSWDGLANHLRQKKAPLEKAVELGLLVKNENNRIYDRFRGRIMFPIFSETGTLTGFRRPHDLRRRGQVPEFSRFPDLQKGQPPVRLPPEQELHEGGKGRPAGRRLPGHDQPRTRRVSARWRPRWAPP